MDFRIYSRPGVEACEPHDVEHVIISIRTPGDPAEVALPICDKTLGVLRLEFHDADEAPTQPIPALLLRGESIDEHVVTEPREAVLFDETFGARVLAFVAAYLDRLERVIVHCDAGLSRSPAVAAALAKTIFAQDDTPFFKAYRPNMRVYRSILNAADEPLEAGTVQSYIASLPRFDDHDPED